MALTGKYVTIDNILERVYRDYGFEDDLDWMTAIDWIGDALDMIGATTPLIKKTTDGNAKFGHYDPIEICNHRGDLPCDLAQINSVREYTTKTSMTEASNTFHVGANADVDTTVSPYLNNETLSSATETENTTRYAQPLQYEINGGKIFTSFKDGQVEMSYWAYPTDDRGFPLIPDEIYFKNACSNYVAHKLSRKLAGRNQYNPQMAQQIEQDWLFYVQAAKSKAIMPSIDKMESIKNQWLRLIPQVNEHDSHFVFLSNQQNRTIHNAK
jgi:hypothetical protein